MATRSSQSDVGEHQPERAAGCADARGSRRATLSAIRAGTGAERGAHGELLPPRVGPHEHEIRDVGARDEKHGADRAHEHPQRARHAADQVVLQRPNDRGDSPVRDRSRASR